MTTTPNASKLNSTLVWIMAVACGAAVANIYYAQPLLDTLSSVFNTSTATTGLIVTATQIGYAMGLLLLVPLGDLLNRRKLIVTIMLGTALAQLFAAQSENIGFFLSTSLIIGLTSVAAQILVPFAATLAQDHNRGTVVGRVMSGLLLGILLARTVSGFVADAAGWQTVFRVAGGLMVLQAAILWRMLPDPPTTSRLSYIELLRSLWPLLRDEPVLRRRCVYGTLMFTTFSALWTTLPFLLGHAPYRYSDTAIGSFGLIGACGALSASIAGKLSDRGWSRMTTGISMVLVFLSFWLMDSAGEKLAAIIIGVAVMDLGIQSIQILNQTEIYRIRPEARSRITTVYLSIFFIGGAVSSSLSAALYQAYGWHGVCRLCMGLAATALLFWASEWRQPARISAEAGR